jgi:pyrimidine operon attenuation protein / uracil phosphoribosyltransferase
MTSDLLNFEALYQQLRLKLVAFLDQQAISNPLMIGVHAGGAWLAQRLHTDLQIRSPLGAISIAYYRDDFASNGLQARSEKTHLPVDVSERDVILVDDILYTGRTVRAAINELFDFGRPRSISFVCLLTRNGRQLPIQADVSAGYLELPAGESIKLRGPAPLYLEKTQRINV